jgi:hypothetical protein
VHLSVQYSVPDFAAMTRRIARGASHCGQSNSTLAAGDGLGLVSDSGMGYGPFSNRVIAFSSEVETGSREENASKTKSQSPVLIQSEPIRL